MGLILNNPFKIKKLAANLVHDTRTSCFIFQITFSLTSDGVDA